MAAILDFIDSGHDVVLAAEGGASDVVRDIATECGVDLEEVSAGLPATSVPSAPLTIETFYQYGGTSLASDREYGTADRLWEGCLC